MKIFADGQWWSTNNEDALRKWIAAGKPGKENLIWQDQIYFENQHQNIFPTDNN